MVSFTTNLRLHVPAFDQDPWDEDVNDNWYTLDATVAKFFGVANLTGVWKNATPYAYGQSAVDFADGSIWTCNIAHTSAAVPTTFAEDRLANPGYWIESVSTAQEYAQAAADSAGAAQVSAGEAAESAADAAAAEAVVNGALPITGGTMTGELVLFGDPVNVLAAATRQYVDARVGGVGYLPTTGGTMTGAITLAGNPSGALDAAPKQYVDLFMPTAGGTFTGSITSNGNVSAGAGMYAAGSPGYTLVNSGAAFTSDSNYTNLVFDSGNWRWQYNRAAGHLQYVRGSDNVALATINSSGDISAVGNLYANANIFLARNVANNFYLAGDGSNLYLNFENGYALVWNRSNGIYTLSSPSGPRMTVDTGGNGVFAGNMSCQGVYASGGLFQIAPNYYMQRGNDGHWRWVEGGTVNMELSNDGNMAALAAITAGGSVFAGVNVVASQNVFASGNQMVMGNGGAGRLLQMSPSWYWEWNSSNGTLIWNTPSGYEWIIHGAGQCYNERAWVGGHGAYQDLSDERSKRDVKPANEGLDAVCAIKPIKFIRVGMPEAKVELGFSAQQLADVLPEAVTETTMALLPGAAREDSDPPSLAVATTPIVAALVNGMKELVARIEALEGTRA